MKLSRAHHRELDALKPAEPEPLEFRGRDAEECEKFINAVSRQALAVGKQRDDRWTADFAASCFTHGALRWWDGLDEQTQCSWKLLRKAMLARYRPLFHGRGGEEAEEFVHMIHERALDVGKQQDNEWIAAFVASSFVGDALRWYVSLDPGVQNDWKRLRQAILTQYPRGGAGIASFITIPTPAPAALPAPPAPPMVIRQRGRIRVVSAARSNPYYVSKIPDGAGFVILTENISEILQVEYNPSSRDKQTLHIPNDDNSLRNKFKER
ncbi:hypothetical protein FRC05_001999 [Tulasnella sp. 425]|nr:hypothetical protein FRC05_001999 [Tulasnella sp. 425]